MKIVEVVNYDITTNVKFMEWFKGSKCVDRNGRPLKVYHGTMNGVEVPASAGFGNSELGKLFATTGKPGAPEALTHFEPHKGDSMMNPVNQEAGKGYHGSYFTSNANYAAQYGSAIYPVYLWIGKLYVANSYRDIANMDEDKVGWMKLHGYDGAMYDGDGKPDEWVVWSSWQVKSATGNNGNYSDSDHIGEGVCGG